mgnify:CR=1 FL=1
MYLSMLTINLEFELLFLKRTLFVHRLAVASSSEAARRHQCLWTVVMFVVYMSSYYCCDVISNANLTGTMSKFVSVSACSVCSPAGTIPTLLVRIRVTRSRSMPLHWVCNLSQNTPRVFLPAAGTFAKLVTRFFSIRVFIDITLRLDLTDSVPPRGGPCQLFVV